MANILRLVIDQPRQEALEGFAYCFGLTERNVVDSEEPTCVDVGQLLIMSLLLVLNNSIIETSLTASGRKRHRGQLIPVHGQFPFFLLFEGILFSLGTSSNQRLELRTLPGRIVVMLRGLVWADNIIVLDLRKLRDRAQSSLILLCLILLIDLLFLLLIILPLNYIVVDENGRRNRRLIGNAGLLVELSLPAVSPFKRLRIRSIGHDDAAGDVPRVQGLEGGGGVHVCALVPQLHPDLLAVDPQNLEREVSVGSQPRELCVLFFLVVLIFIGSSVGDLIGMVRCKLGRRHKHCRGMVSRRLREGVGARIVVFEYLYY